VTTRQLLQLFAWGISVLVMIMAAIVFWAWSVPDVVDPSGRLVADTARVQTRTLLVLLVGFGVMVGGGFFLARRNDRARSLPKVR
jgi:hypothetical protein